MATVRLGIYGLAVHYLLRRLLSGVGSALLTPSLLAAIAVAQASPSVFDEPLDAGYQLYELGILPDGVPLRATRPEGFTLEGRSAACVTCHRRSGMGSVEGLLERTILVPPVAGALLFAPSRFAGTFLDPSHHYLPNDA